MKNLIRILSLFGLIGLSSLWAQTTPSTTPTDPAKLPTPAEIRARIGALPDSVKSLLQQFQATRSTIIEQRKELLKTLKTATKEERKAIIDEFLTAQKELTAEQKALAKQIREEVRKLRQERRNAVTTGG